MGGRARDVDRDQGDVLQLGGGRGALSERSAGSGRLRPTRVSSGCTGSRDLSQKLLTSATSRSWKHPTGEFLPSHSHDLSRSLATTGCQKFEGAWLLAPIPILNPFHNEVAPSRKSSQLLAVTGAVALFAGALVLALPAQAKQTGKPAVQVGCQHSITLQQLDSSFQATQIRVKPYGGGANIGSAIAPAGWTVTTSPTGAVFKLQGGGVISVGSHSGFSINLGSTSQAHQYVLVEWMTAEGEVICGQPLYVPCGAVQARSVREATGPAVPIYSGPICGCLNASTEADDTSDILDTDIDVNIVQIVNAGFLKFNVLYTLELDPINTPITKTWQLIAFDETGNEAVLSIQPTADTYDPQSGQWQATFTVTDGWDFDVTLSVTSKLACLNNPEGSRESAEDEDTGSYRANGVPSEIEVTPSDPCDPYKYVFTDVTDPVGTQPIVWTVAQTGYAPQAVPPDSSGSYTYSFPNGNVPYDVCRVATDPTSSVPRPMVCEQVTPATGSLNVKFRWENSFVPYQELHCQIQEQDQECEVPGGVEVGFRRRYALQHG